MSSVSPISLNEWILALAAKGPAHVDPGPFVELLRRQLRARRMHQPAWLGLRDHREWDQAALLELCGILYTRFLVAKLPDYQRDAQIRDVTGLIITAVQWRFTDLQREADPEGHAVYKNVEQAVTLAIEAGALLLDLRTSRDLRGQTGKLDNQSLLCTTTRESTAQAAKRTNAVVKPGLMLDLDRDEIHGRLISQADWSALKPKLTTRSKIHSARLFELLQGLWQGPPLRFRMADLVDAVKAECCTQIENHEITLESQGQWDEPPTASLRDHETRLRQAIDQITANHPRRTRLQDLLTRCLDHWDEHGGLIEATDHAQHASLSKSSAYEDLDLLKKVIQDILTGDSRKNAN